MGTRKDTKYTMGAASDDDVSAPVEWDTAKEDVNEPLLVIRRKDVEVGQWMFDVICYVDDRRDRDGSRSIIIRQSHLRAQIDCQHSNGPYPPPARTSIAAIHRVRRCLTVHV